MSDTGDWCFRFSPDRAGTFIIRVQAQEKELVNWEFNVLPGTQNFYASQLFIFQHPWT